MPQRNDDVASLARAVMELIDQGHRGISRVLDLPRMRVLGFVAARGPTRPGTIATELRMTKSAVSRHLTALHEAGQVAVHKDPHDARTYLTAITPAGRVDSASTTAAGTARFARVVADWADEDVRAARAAIEALLQAWLPPEPTRDGPTADHGGPQPRGRRTRPVDDHEDDYAPDREHEHERAEETQ